MPILLSTFAIMIDWNIIFSQIATVAFDIIYFGAIIGTIVVVILDNRNPVKTMAWILVLMFLPIVGLVFYFFFGRSQRRERIIGKKSYGRLLKKPMAEYLAQGSSVLPEAYERLIKLFQHTNQALPFEGNRVDTYTSGYSMLQALLRELQKAEKHIHMEFYIFEDDAVGRLVRDVLIGKARAGVEVRVIYDDVGCWHVPSAFFEDMRGAGIEVRSFLKVRFPLFTSKVNYRNHRKIVVIDGLVGFVGGMNLAERYMRGFFWGIWRDTHIMLQGKAVHGLQSAFLLDWYFVDRTLITSSRYFPKIDSYGDSLVQIVTGEPIGPWKEIMQGLTMAISGAQRYFYIQTPYFLPTEQVLAAMQAAAGGERSVDLESLNRIRSRWIDEGLKKLDEGANTVLKYDNQIVVPFLEYLRSVRDAGHLEAYNYWVLREGNKTAFGLWVSDNRQKFNDFMKWFEHNRLKIADAPIPISYL